MFFKMIHKERRIIQLYTLVLFLILSLVFLAITLYAQTNEDRIQRNRIEANEQGTVDAEKAQIENKIGRRVSDLMYIADSLLLGYSNHETDTEIEQQWIAFSNRMAIYDQIRYIGLSGDEIIRVNYREGSAAAVAKSELQNKKDRYYFTNTISLQRNQAYVSPLDLNIENNAIELPIKPMLRLATPYFGTSGGLEGIVILNYSADDMLRQVAAIASTSIGDIFLLNLDGYWLYNSGDRNREWAFMYEDRTDESFANEFPDEWDIISGTESGRLNTGNGAFFYTTVTLETAIAGTGESASLFYDTGVFHVVSFIPSDTEAGALFSGDFFCLVGKTFSRYLSFYFLLSGFAFILAAFIGISRAQKREIKYFSEFDAMTGVYNRRAGYNRMNELKKDLSKKDCKIAICFIDINGLKEVNDTLGHDAGDELILSAVGVIRDSVRDKDFIARLGGDEFLIVFDGLDAEGAEMVWARIAQRFEQINAEESRKYAISVSHGVGTFYCNMDLTVDAVVSRADEKMYLEKKEIKRTLKVLRD